MCLKIFLICWWALEIKTVSSCFSVRWSLQRWNVFLLTMSLSLAIFHCHQAYELAQKIMGAVWAATPSIGIQLHFSHASSPGGSISKPGNGEQMLLAPLQPSSISRCNPRFPSRRCLPTWASRFTSMDLTCRMATSMQRPWASMCTIPLLCPFFLSFFVRCCLET